MNHTSSTQSETHLAIAAPNVDGVLPNASVLSSATAAALSPAHTGQTSAEPTQLIQWQLPQEPRFYVTRGGKGRDWRAELSVLAGLSALTLLLVTLTHWPHAAARVPAYTASSAADTVTAPQISRPSVPSNSLSPSSMIASAAGAAPAMPAYPDAAGASPGLRYSHLPVPGYGTFATAPICLPYAPANVPPAAPTALGPPVVRYSY